jgi:pimeloyl-ACP methyl ester carboxylesterase
VEWDLAFAEQRLRLCDRRNIVTYIRSFISTLLIGMLPAVAGCSGEDSTDPESGLPKNITLPIVFAHGGAGSAQQYASQAIRFALNGYPQNRIVAYDHDGAGFDVEQFVPGLDAVVDGALDEFDAEKVYLVGHSRGTLLSSRYLSDPAKRAKVAKYISLDGAPCTDALGVPCIAPNQALLTGQKHVEVATSKESFAMQYQFIVGEAPKVVDIAKQSGPVVLEGRAVNFPANTGRDGAKLEFWEVDPATGRRTASAPVQSFDIGADGNWGPMTVSPDKHYELLLYTPGAGLYQHVYPQPFLRTSYLERILSGPPDSPSRVNSNLGEGHAALTVLRMREWLADDVLEVSLTGDAGNIQKRNVITAEAVVGPAGGAGLGVGQPIAVYLHDDAMTPKETTLELLPYFPEQFFQTGVDVYLPAADPPNGTITVTSTPRGYADKPQTLNVPNWPSANHTVMVVFSDFAQD